MIPNPDQYKLMYDLKKDLPKSNPQRSLYARDPMSSSGTAHGEQTKTTEQATLSKVPPAEVAKKPAIIQSNQKWAKKTEDAQERLVLHEYGVIMQEVRDAFWEQNRVSFLPSEALKQRQLGDYLNRKRGDSVYALAYTSPMVHNLLNRIRTEYRTMGIKTRNYKKISPFQERITSKLL